MADKLVARHSDGAKPVTPFTDLSSTLQFGTLGKRGAAVASATGLALTAMVSAAASATAPTAVPAGPAGDFVSNLATQGSATLVSLDVEWDSGDSIKVKAEEAAPEPVVEAVPEQAATRDYVREDTAAAATVTETVVETETQAEAATEYVAPAAPAPTVGSSVVATALQYVGYPYVWGAAGPNAFDCSGFTSYIYGLHGITLSRSSYAQGSAGVVVSYAEAQPGDLAVRVDGGHVGIYMGNGQIVHAANPSEGVKVGGLYGSYYFVRL